MQHRTTSHVAPQSGETSDNISRWKQQGLWWLTGIIYSGNMLQNLGFIGVERGILDSLLFNAANVTGNNCSYKTTSDNVARWKQHAGIYLNIRQHGTLYLTWPKTGITLGNTVCWKQHTEICLNIGQHWMLKTTWRSSVQHRITCHVVNNIRRWWRCQGSPKDRAVTLAARTWLRNVTVKSIKS